VEEVIDVCRRRENDDVDDDDDDDDDDGDDTSRADTCSRSISAYILSRLSEERLLRVFEPAGVGRPRDDDDDNDDDDNDVCDAAPRLSDAASTSPARRGPAAGLPPPSAASPTLGVTTGRAGGGLSKGRATEKVVDEDVDVLLGDVVELLTMSRVLASTDATGCDDVTLPFCNNTTNNSVVE